MVDLEVLVFRLRETLWPSSGCCVSSPAGLCGPCASRREGVASAVQQLQVSAHVPLDLVAQVGRALFDTDTGHRWGRCVSCAACAARAEFLDRALVLLRAGVDASVLLDPVHLDVDFAPVVPADGHVAANCGFCRRHERLRRDALERLDGDPTGLLAPSTATFPVPPV